MRDTQIILGPLVWEILIFNMATDPLTLEKRKSRQNAHAEIVEAKIIANYGDPGLDEDYHFDVLSRYVIVMIESCQRVVTADKYSSMIAIVKRPSSLWISANTQAASPNDQQRIDASNNVSVGLAGGFSVDGISRISPAYNIGDTIRIRKMSQPEQPPTSFFYSVFSQWDATTWNYGGWHSEGSTLPYFTTQDMKNQLQQKTIEQLTAGGNYYGGYLNKMQYEAFALTIFQGNVGVTNGLGTIFNNTWGGNPAIYSANGGYLFSNKTFVNLNAVSYEDMNTDGKSRVADNSCIPLVVATPQAFPTPSVRSIGTISYNQKYSPIAR